MGKSGVGRPIPWDSAGDVGLAGFLVLEMFRRRGFLAYTLLLQMTVVSCWQVGGNGGALGSVHSLAGSFANC